MKKLSALLVVSMLGIGCISTTYAKSLKSGLKRAVGKNPIDKLIKDIETINREYGGNIRTYMVQVQKKEYFVEDVTDTYIYISDTVKTPAKIKEFSKDQIVALYRAIIYFMGTLGEADLWKHGKTTLRDREKMAIKWLQIIDRAGHSDRRSKKNVEKLSNINKAIIELTKDQRTISR